MSTYDKSSLLKIFKISLPDWTLEMSLDGTDDTDDDSATSVVTSTS